MIKPNQSYVLGMSLQVSLVLLFGYNVFAIPHPQTSAFSLSSNILNYIFTSNYISYTYIILLILNIGLFTQKIIIGQRSNRRLRENNIPASDTLVDTIAQWKAKMGIRRHIRVIIQDSIISPFTKGVLKPIILLPLSFLNGLEMKEMEAILLHELWHIKRYDYLFLNLQLWMEKIMYFNPFFLLISKAIHEDRELACDINSINTNNSNSINYIDALLFFYKIKQTGPIASPTELSLTGRHSSELANRAAYLLEGKKSKRFQASIGMNTIAITALILSTFSLDKKQPISANNTNKISTSIAAVNKQPIKEIVDQPLVKNRLNVQPILKDEKTTTKETENIENKSIIKIKNKRKTSKTIQQSPDRNNNNVIAENNTDKRVNPLVRMTSYIQTANTKEATFKLLEINANRAVFALVDIQDPEQLNLIFSKTVDNISNHFPIESSAYQYSSVSNNGHSIESSSIELKSIDYKFLLIKRSNAIYLAVSPSITSNQF